MFDYCLMFCLFGLTFYVGITCHHFLTILKVIERYVIIIVTIIKNTVTLLLLDTIVRKNELLYLKSNLLGENYLESHSEIKSSILL